MLFSLSILSPGFSNGWTQTLKLKIMWQVFYHCATFAGRCILFSLTILSPGFSNGWNQTLNLKICGKCSTNALPLLVRRILSSLTIFSTGFGNGWTQTLNHRQVRQVFYHSATSSGQFNTFLPFSLSWSQQGLELNT
jgi:hypothetical protein